MNELHSESKKLCQIYFCSPPGLSLARQRAERCVDIAFLVFNDTLGDELSQNVLDKKLHQIFRISIYTTCPEKRCHYILASNFAKY